MTRFSLCQTLTNVSKQVYAFSSPELPLFRAAEGGPAYRNVRTLSVVYLLLLAA